MGKLKDAHVFSNEKGSIAKFFVYLAIFLVYEILDGFFDKVVYKKSFEWGEYLLTYIIFAAVLTIFYFVGRLLAYRTNIFPNAKYREAIHGMSFFLMMILSIILAIVIIGGKG